MSPAMSHRIEFWPTSEGVHVVAIYADCTVRQVGVLWIEVAA